MISVYHSDEANGLVVGAVGLARNGFVGLSVGGAGSASVVWLVLRPAFTNPLPDDCSTEPYDDSLLFLSTLTCCANFSY